MQLLKIARRVTLTFLLLLALSWLTLYIESCWQLKKAERLISDLKSFPFATATFADVRDLTIRNGGSPRRSPLTSITQTCTIQDCYFDIYIRPLTMNSSCVGQETNGLHGYSSMLACGRGTLEHSFTRKTTGWKTAARA
jgi:hypothetical protein